MKNEKSQTVTIHSVEDYHELMGIEKPMHPLMSIIDFSKTAYREAEEKTTIVNNLYTISIKQGTDCLIRYGPHYYDFRQGVMSFFKPGQLVIAEPGTPHPEEGFMINFHPDFIRSYALDQKIKGYHFFNYEVNESLFLSDKEKIQIRLLMEGIMTEYQTNIDTFSQDAIVAFLDLLMVYSNRFYTRQFITRKPHTDPTIVKFEKLLDAFYQSDSTLHSGLPNVKYFAEQMNMSSNYLSDMLRISTGQSAQSHIQNRIIEEAKTLLSTSELTVAEIAYRLGFEQPQSLNRLFKKKTEVSPLEFRASFN